ncbi:MAG: 2-dehydropantoate 2-reductase [Verrucomicrobiota bacterium]|nr:2-dehydropantoate 2-reductase [Verrucomicrobiota bacterium]
MAERWRALATKSSSLRAEKISPRCESDLCASSIRGDFEIEVGAAAPAEEIGAVDLVLVAVKAWQVPEVAATISPLLGSPTVVVPLENGVEVPAQLASALGADHIVGGFCKIVAFMAGPGHVRHIGAEPSVAFGELEAGSERRRLPELRDVFVQAGIACEIPSDIVVAMWEKFIFIAPLGGMGAMTGLPFGAFKTTGPLRTQLEAGMREMAEVAGALRVNFPEDTVAKTMSFVDTLQPDGVTSMQRDISAGRPSELDAQNGSVARLGRAAGVPTPTHEAICAALAPREKRARALAAAKNT